MTLYSYRDAWCRKEGLSALECSRELFFVSSAWHSSTDRLTPCISALLRPSVCADAQCFADQVVGLRYQHMLHVQVHTNTKM